MSSLLVTARVAHFTSAMLLFGIVLFELAVAKPTPRGQGLDHEALQRRLRAAAAWSLAASIASVVVWLVCQTAAISGIPLTQAVSRDALALVLGKTAFGRVWIVRMGIALLLAALLWLAQNRRHDPRNRFLALAAIVLAGAYLATLAWIGHAAAGKNPEREIQLPSDAIHLLAAGAWLGALAGLAFLIAMRQPPGVAAQALRRFSTLGVISVSALTVTGLVNAWYLVGDIPALIGTPYGRLLLMKLVLFAAMMALAATNRLVLTRRIAQGSLAALSSLRRNALIEVAAGIGIVVIVGVLGITVPAAHDSPVWPFGYTLEWPHEESMPIRAALSGLGVAMVAGVLAIVGGTLRRRSSLRMAGIAVVAVAVVAATWLLAVPANPMSYAASPVRYTATAIARGGAIFAQHCATCHGAFGRGDAPAAVSLTIKPADLPGRTPSHRAGDLYWWIAHGISDTPMPGFSRELSDRDLWSVVVYVRAVSDGWAARSMTRFVEPWRPIVAPDFTFELGRAGQESLGQLDERAIVLLVFFTLPQSQPRLDELAAQTRDYANAGVRVIALPTPVSAKSGDAEAARIEGSIVAVADPQVATVYAMFARRLASGAVASEPIHLEFLVDPPGYLRARWLGIPDQATRRTSEILAQAELLKREPPRPPAAELHAH